MKAIKYFLVGALMTVIGAPAVAQEITLDDALKVVADNDKTVKEKEQALKAAKFSKKDLTQDIRVGNAFLACGDTLSAKKYAEFGKKADKNSAEPYILLGDIEAYSDNPGAAAAWYESAIYFDPNNPTGYIRYAAVNSYSSPALAVQKLEELKTKRPDYPVYAEAAHIYYNVATKKNKTSMLTDALNYYKKTELSQLKDDRLTEYALIAYLTKDYETSLKVSKFGLQNKPTNAGYNRLALYNATELKNYAEAVPYISSLMSADSVKVILNDYKYAASALEGNKQYEEAIGYWNKVIDEATSNNDKLAAYKAISDDYKNMNQMDKSLDMMKKYLAENPEASYTDYNSLATIYKKMGAEQTGAAQEASYQEAIKAYQMMSEKYANNPGVVQYAEFLSARLATQLDPKTEKGTAKPYYEKLVSSIEANGIKENTDKVRITEGYNYLGYYYIVKKDNATAKSYYQKILNIDPENTQAKQAFDSL